MRVTVTGGAGFIGSHLVDLLIEKGYRVLVVDSLERQVHHGKKPSYLNKKAKYIFDRCEKKDVLKEYIPKTDILIHLAASVGVGQSMYQIKKYVKGNTYATASILEYLSCHRHKIKKILVASSMSIYGEGKYYCSKDGVFNPQIRTEKQLSAGNWDYKCPSCGKNLVPIATSEDKPLYPTSIYAVTKRDQEEMVHIIGKAYNIPTVALRFFNVYGSRQSLSNPYTGVLAIFASRLLNNHSPVIYEDGNQTRDFINVSDLVQGILLAMENDSANCRSINLGTGIATSVKMIATIMQHHIRKDGEITITNRFRNGDIRHCFADITLAKKLLGFKPKIRLKNGLLDYIEWLSTQESADNFAKVERELKTKGLV